MSLEIREGNKVYKLNNEYVITSIIDFNYVFAKSTSTFCRDAKNLATARIHTWPADA